MITRDFGHGPLTIDEDEVRARRGQQVAVEVAQQLRRMAALVEHQARDLCRVAGPGVGALHLRIATVADELATISAELQHAAPTAEMDH